MRKRIFGTTHVKDLNEVHRSSEQDALRSSRVPTKFFHVRLRMPSLVHNHLVSLLALDNDEDFIAKCFLQSHNPRLHGYNIYVFHNVKMKTRYAEEPTKINSITLHNCLKGPYRSSLWVTSLPCCFCSPLPTLCLRSQAQTALCVCFWEQPSERCVLWQHVASWPARTKFLGIVWSSQHGK